MDNILLIVTIIIQALAVAMVLYTFYRISQNNFPQLSALEKYHVMRKRYERLRISLLFVGAIIFVQLFGLFFYLQNGTIPLLQLLISDIVVIGLVLLLSKIYKERHRLQELEFDDVAVSSRNMSGVKNDAKNDAHVVGAKRAEELHTREEEPTEEELVRDEKLEPVPIQPAIAIVKKARSVGKKTTKKKKS